MMVAFIALQSVLADSGQSGKIKLSNHRLPKRHFISK
tara:strand:- start:148616 stop:148726 length:111 start_codon:yes stop_codon:yes gene_type:complete